jgi:hypothetical protein
MKINYDDVRTINIHKAWDGVTDDGIAFTIDGGWNDSDGYYVESIEFEDFEGDNEEELIEQISTEFLNKMNG